MRKILALAAAALLAVTISACTYVPPAERHTPPPAPGPDTIEAPPSFAPPAEEEPPEPGLLAFGEAMTWEDGMGLSVGVPAEFTPSEYSVRGGQPFNIRFTVTVTNGTDAPYDDYVYSTMTSGGAAGEQIFDSANGLSGPPSGAILPGQSISFDVGFNVADPAALVLQISPGFEYENIIFTNVAS